MKTLVFLFFIIPVISLGQEVRWNFENNDLTQWYQNVPGRWEISESPINGSLSLHHAYGNEQAGTDWIFIPHPLLNLNEATTTWQFSISYQYDPSAKNHWEVMLSSSSIPGDDRYMDYALVLGVNFRGSDDEIHLWKQKGEFIESIMNTNFNWQEKINKGNPVSFKMIRSVNGFITLEIDTGRNGNFFKIGETMESEIITSGSFLLSYSYTASADRLLFFDDLFISGKFRDSISPLKIESIQMNSPNCLLVEFNQIIKITGENYFTIEGNCIGKSRITTGKYIFVDLTQSLTPGTDYQIGIPDISDMFGNSNNLGRQKFYYPAAYDIVINEIMADPSPAVLLPETEYLELLNTTHKNISLFNWLMRINNRICSLPNITIDSSAYIVLCDEALANSFQLPGVIIARIRDFPPISNEDAGLILLDPSGRLIDAVHYSNKWYNSPEKKSGGWSLELTDAKIPCSEGENWKESENFKGGTPGMPNSVINGNLHNNNPAIWRAAVTDSGSLMLYFSEPMDSLSLINPNSYFVDHGVGTPSTVKPKWPLANVTELFFQKKFERETGYKISFTRDLCDCSGLQINNAKDVFFEIPEIPDSGDIIMNEVMFDPKDQFQEYIELYNRSMKTIDIKDYQLFLNDSLNGKNITTDYFPILPGDYAVIVRSVYGINSEEEFDLADKTILMLEMNILPNEGQNLQLISPGGIVLDRIYYSHSFHHENLSDTKGVSLERINPDISGMDPSNWQSASSDAGYQTPATVNSQTGRLNNNCSISIYPKTITPNSDGRDDELTIDYSMDEPAYMARILIFNKSGQQVFSIARGSLLGTSGSYIYNGSNDQGYKVSPGIYILYFEAYKQNKRRSVMKRSFVIVN